MEKKSHFTIMLKCEIWSNTPKGNIIVSTGKIPLESPKRTEKLFKYFNHLSLASFSFVVMIIGPVHFFKVLNSPCPAIIYAS